MAWVLEQWDSCPGCGHPLSVSSSYESDGRYAAEESICFGCEARQRRERRYEGKDTPGLMISARRKGEG